MPAREIFFLAAEPSADLHVSLLAAELLRRGDYRLTGAGGPLMRAAGVQTDFDSSGWATMGIVQAFHRVPEAWVTRRQMLRLFRQRRPDLVVLVDFGGFNVNIGHHIRRFPWHTPVLYYFPPRSWDKTEHDRSRLGRVADVVATPFRWSEALLRKDGIDAHWVGHPVVDRLQPVTDPSPLREQLGLPPAERVVGLLPGSRRRERALIGPPMIEAATRLIAAATRPLAEADYHFLWSPGPPGTVDRLAFPPQLRAHLTVVQDSAAIVQASDLVLSAFGTTTLEATAAGTPLIGMYRGTPMDALVFRMMRLPTKMFAMPNIILGYKAVPELLQDDCDADHIVRCVAELFADPLRLPKMKEELGRARQELGPPGAIARAADLVETTLARAEAKH